MAMAECKTCEGKGRVRVKAARARYSAVMPMPLMICPDCGGTGEVKERDDG